MNNALVTLQSPQGGQPMKHFDTTRKEANVLHSRETGELVILDDVLSYEIGYMPMALRGGERARITMSHAKKLWKEWDYHFNDSFFNRLKWKLKTRIIKELQK